MIVELGNLRPMSDTSGRHVVRMDGSIAVRQELAQRLRTAGCRVNLDGTDWHTEGDFQAAIAVSVAPEVSQDSAESSTTLASPMADDDESESGRLTAADYVNLGEHLWYLSNPPRASVDNIVKAIRGFLGKLDSCDLPKTRVAANPLSELTLHYDVHTNLISWHSLRALEAMMVPIRSALESEARSRL